MNLKNLGMIGKIILVPALLLAGFLFVVHGLGFAYLSFLLSLGSVTYLAYRTYSIYRLKRYDHGNEHGNKLKFCFDIVAFIVVLAMIFVSVFPNILFFPGFLENGKKPTVELYSNLEDGNIPQETFENRNMPYWKMTIYRLSNSIQRAEFNSNLKNGYIPNDEYYSKPENYNFLEKEEIEKQFFSDSRIVANYDFLESIGVFEYVDSFAREIRNYQTLLNQIKANTVIQYSKLKNGFMPSKNDYSIFFSGKPFLQGFLLKFPVTSATGIPFSSYNAYSYFVFVFNLIFPFVGICILILYLVLIIPVIKTWFALRRQPLKTAA